MLLDQAEALPTFRRQFFGYRRAEVDAFIRQMLATQAFDRLTTRPGQEHDVPSDPVVAAERTAKAIVAQAEERAQRIIQDAAKQAEHNQAELQTARMELERLAALRRNLSACLEQISASASSEAQKLLAPAP